MNASQATGTGLRMNDDVTHPVFGYKLSYRRMIILKPIDRVRMQTELE